MVKITKYISLVLAATLMLSIAGCKDFLDVKPRGKEIPRTIEHYDKMFNSTNLTTFQYIKIVGSLTQQLENTLYNLFMTDEIYATKSSKDNFTYLMNQAFGWQENLFSEEDNAVEWALLYQHIYTFNVIANEVMNAEKGTEEQKMRLLSEARANRALRYLILAQYFGKPYNESTAATDPCVPLVTKADMTQTNLKRNSVKEVYDFVISELEEACPYLGESTIHHLRVYKSAGYLFLGKAYLYKGDYENARKALEIALRASKVNTIGTTLYDYNTTISQWGYNAATPYRWTSGFPSNVTGANKEVIYNYQFVISSIASATGQPKLFVKPQYMALYGANDHRSKFFSDKTTTNAQLEGFRRLSSRTIFSLGAEMPDLYLMLIEAQARSTDPAIQAEARENLEFFRKHRMPAANAKIPANIVTQSDLIRFVIEERSREYLMTGLRWFDMRRLWNDPLFQDYKAKYTHTDGENNYTLTEERLVYKIPPKIMVYHSDWDNN